MTARGKGKVIGYFPSVVKQRGKTRLMKLLGKSRGILHVMLILHIILNTISFLCQNNRCNPSKRRFSPARDTAACRRSTWSSRHGKAWRRYQSGSSPDCMLYSTLLQPVLHSQVRSCQTLLYRSAPALPVLSRASPCIILHWRIYFDYEFARSNWNQLSTWKAWRS